MSDEKPVVMAQITANAKRCLLGCAECDINAVYCTISNLGASCGCESPVEIFLGVSTRKITDGRELWEVADELDGLAEELANLLQQAGTAEGLKMILRVIKGLRQTIPEDIRVKTIRSDEPREPARWVLKTLNV